MGVYLQSVKYEDKVILSRLLELYLYDSSEYTGQSINEHGLFNYKYLDHFWTEPNRHAYFGRANGQLAGFVLIRGLTDPLGQYHTPAEFFVLRQFRRRGIGTAMAAQTFDLFPGRWRVHQQERNTPAQAFWQRAIERYTGGNYRDIQEKGWDGPVQEFCT